MLLELENVHKSYRGRPALSGASLELDEGQVVGLAGVNGAGKTTTIRLLMGLLEADSGRLQVFGRDPLDRLHLAQVGWMSENPRFPAGLTVDRLIAFQAATQPRWDEALAGELRDRLAITASARAGDLSRGQAARLALLLALAHRPRLLLLDDPCLGLDPQGRRLLLGELLGAASEQGAAVMLSTHLLGEADRALDRLVILDHGRIVLDEPVDSLKARCRRLHLPVGVDVPQELAPIAAGLETVATRWDEAVWQRYRHQVPQARAQSLDLEDIFVAITGADT